MTSSARDRTIKIVTCELPRGQEYVSPHVVDALIARPEVLRDLLGTTVQEWGANDIADDPNAPTGDVDPADDEDDAHRAAASWAGGRVCWRDVTYGPWRTQ